MYRLAERIIKLHAKEYGSSVARIKGRMKTPHLIEIRTRCMRDILINTDLSRAEVGVLFYNRSRSTVIRLLSKLKQKSKKSLV